MKYLFLLLSFLLVGSLRAQEDLNTRDPRLNEGGLFTVQLVPGDRRLIVSLAGHPEVEMGPGKITIFGRTIGPGGQIRKFDIRPSGSAFTWTDPLPSGQKIEIDIQEKGKDGKKQTLKMEAP